MRYIISIYQLIAQLNKYIQKLKPRLSDVLAAQTFSIYKLESQKGRLDCIKDISFAR
jgi:hypothetical protein